MHVFQAVYRSSRYMFLWWLIFILPAQAEWDIDLDRLHEWGQQLWETHAPPAIRDEFELLPPDQWGGLWRQLDAALLSDSLYDLAWMRPELEAATAWLNDFEETAPYAAWLQQRLDYARMAERAVAQHGPEPAVIRRVPATQDPQIQTPPPRPAARVPVSSRDQQAMNDVVGNRERWVQEMSGRPLPPRAEALLPRLKAIFAEEGAPTELVWVAEVESTFNPTARSPVGAVGLFQFMPATAESFGMSVSPTDQRLDPELNARAAARYLRQLHRRFDSWELALAAYNGGQGRVARLLRTHDADSFEEIAAYLPAETRMYVPKVMATIAVREGLDPTFRLAGRTRASVGS